MVELSIVLTAYNSENEIKKMLSSISGQRYRDYEVITVDDGSTDNTLDVVTEFCQKHNAFRVIHQNNGGVSSARNRGLLECTGKYVAFFDSDDYLEPDSIDIIMSCARKNDADVVIAKSQIHYLNDTMEPVSCRRLAMKPLIKKYDYYLIWNFSLANKIFRRKFFTEQSISFSPYNHMEDGLVEMEYILKGQPKKIVGCDQLLYHYVKRPFWQGTSLSQKGDETAFADVMHNFLSITKTVEESIKLDLESAENSSQNIKEELCYNAYRFRSDLYKRLYITNLVNEFYRRIWFNQDLYPCIVSAMQNCERKTFPAHLQMEKNKLRDIVFREGLPLPPDELAKQPLISIIVLSGIETSLISTVIDGLYNQDCPSFEVFVPSEYAEYIDIDYDCMPNFHFYEGNIKAVIELVNGQYVWIADRPAIPSPRLFRESLNKIDNNNYVTIPFLVKENTEYKPAKEITTKRIPKRAVFRTKNKERFEERALFSCLFQKRYFSSVFSGEIDFRLFLRNLNETVKMKNGFILIK